MTHITVNGQPHEIASGSTLQDLVATLVEAPQALATAVNQEFVPRQARAQRVLQDDDAVFTFQPITGG